MVEELIKQIEATGNYKVIERLPTISEYHVPSPEMELYKGAYIDVETTGLNQTSDKVIELAIVPFWFDGNGYIYNLEEPFDQFQDPGFPISQEITDLTGITNEMVSGQAIDLAEVASRLDQVRLVIAHNASFDRPFCEGISDSFKDKNWACSISDVNWSEEGFESPKLVFLAYKFGFFYDAHRANVDCLAGIHVLSKMLPKSNIPVLQKLLVNARKTSYHIEAVDAPYAKKDVLKDRGYRWNPGGAGIQKCWHTTVPEEAYEAELQFLKEEIYGRDINIPTQQLTAQTRYKGQ